MIRRVVEEEILSSLIQSAATIAAVLVGFVLGRTQGKYQTQHNESLKVVIELRRLALEVEDSFQKYKDGIALSPDQFSDDERVRGRYDYQKKTDELLLYYRANSPWLLPDTDEKIKPLVEGFNSTSIELAVEVTSSSFEDLERRRQVEQELEEWEDRELKPLLEGLNAETSRLIGTSRSRWRRLFGG